MLLFSDQRYLLLVPSILEREGGLGDSKYDPAAKLSPYRYHTNKGVIWPTYTALCKKLLGVDPTYKHFIALTDAELAQFVGYIWNEVARADLIINTAVAMYVTDFKYTSNFSTLRIQQFLNTEYKAKLVTDNKPGIKTYSALNALSPADALNLIRRARYYHYSELAKDPDWKPNYDGLINRTEKQFVLVKNFLLDNSAIAEAKIAAKRNQTPLILAALFGVLLLS